MSRSWLATLLVLGLGASSAADASAPRPSIVLVSIDTLRADRLSSYGNAQPTSPALDRIAAQSIVFDQAFSQSPKTATSHMSLFTSLYPAAHGVRNLNESRQALPKGIPTLASLLAQAGYRTVAITSGGNVHGGLGFSRGFERYEEMREEEIEGGAEVILQLPETPRKRCWATTPQSRCSSSCTPTRRTIPTSPPPAIVTCSRIRRTPGASSVTIPAWSPTCVERRIRGRPLSRAFWARVDAHDPADRQHLLDLYDASIRYVDDQLGALVARLERLKPPGGFILVVLSDHGEEFQDHGAWQHNTVYQEIVRVPLVMRFPARDGVAPRRVASPVRLIDVMPTLLERVGIPPPRVMDGSSLLPLLRGKLAPRPVFSQWNGLVGFREGRWKLVRKGVLKSELYDLQTDAGEQHDVWASHRALGEALSAEARRIVSAGEAFHATTTAAPAAEPDPELLEQLKALGYLGDGSG